MAKSTFTFHGTVSNKNDRMIEVGQPILFQEISSHGISLYKNQPGIIYVKQAGTYVVNWFVAQSTGLSLDGQNFELQFYDPKGPETLPIAVVSNHVKFSAGAGSAVIEADEGFLLRVVNVSKAPALLSTRCQTLAGITIFGINLEPINQQIDILSSLIEKLTSVAIIRMDSDGLFVIEHQQNMPELTMIDPYILHLSGNYIWEISLTQRTNDNISFNISAFVNVGFEDLNNANRYFNIGKNQNGAYFNIITDKVLDSDPVPLLEFMLYGSTIPSNHPDFIITIKKLG